MYHRYRSYIRRKEEIKKDIYFIFFSSWKISSHFFASFFWEEKENILEEKSLTQKPLRVKKAESSKELKVLGLFSWCNNSENVIDAGKAFLGKDISIFRCKFLIFLYNFYSLIVIVFFTWDFEVSFSVLHKVHF